LMAHSRQMMDLDIDDERCEGGALS